MRRIKAQSLRAAVLLVSRLCSLTYPAEPTVSTEVRLTEPHGEVRLTLPLLPHIEAFLVESSTNLPAGFAPKKTGGFSGISFLDQLSEKREFFRVQISAL